MAWVLHYIQNSKKPRRVNLAINPSIEKVAWRAIKQSSVLLTITQFVQCCDLLLDNIDNRIADHFELQSK